MEIEFAGLAWGSNLLVDVVFVAGTGLAGLFVFGMAKWLPLAFAVILGLILEFLVFWRCVWLAPEMGDRAFGGYVPLPSALGAIFLTGLPGLLVAANLPAVVRRRLSRAQVGRLIATRTDI